MSRSASPTSSTRRRRGLTRWLRKRNGWRVQCRSFATRRCASLCSRAARRGDSRNQVLNGLGKCLHTGPSVASSIWRAWRVATLPTRRFPKYWEDCDIPWLSLNDTDRLLDNDYIEETTIHINELGIQNSSARLLPKGTVFFSRDATIGRCGIAARPMACSQHFIAWVCGARLRPEYLLLALRSMSDELERLTMGATIKTIGMPDVKTLVIPVPPLSEQDQIVAAARDYADRYRKIEAVTRGLMAKLREYRSSLISAAVTGRLDVGRYREVA